MSNELPLGLALLICDQIIEDRFTGKRSLIGLFDGLSSLQFPCVHPVMNVVIEMTNVRGKQACRLLCKHADGDLTAFDARGDVDCPNPNQVVQLVFGFKNLRFEKAGTYWLSLLVDDAPVMSRPLAILQLPPRPQQSPPPS